MGGIDVHFHAIPAFYRDALATAGRGATISTGTPAWSVSAALETMNDNDIQTAILSISQPGTHFGDNNAARILARACNVFFAEQIAERPSRFGAFAVTPLPDVDGALAEITYALDVLHLDGIGILASYGEKFLGDVLFDPVLEELDRRGTNVFVHPNFHPSSRALDLNIPGFVMEFPFDTTRAAINLILSGALERFPRINFILAHAGGTLPFLASRLEAATYIDRRYAGLTRESMNRALAHFWYDTALSSGDASLAALRVVAPAERVLFGSDYPYAPARLVARSVANLAESSVVDAAGRAKITCENALALFPRLRSDGQSRHP